jgi:FkbM family methyltransferase
VSRLVPAFADEQSADDYLWEGASGELGIDVGANTGSLVERMVAAFTRVISIEPAAESFAKLNAAWGSHPQVIVLPIAVTDHEGMLTLEVRTHPIASGQLTAAGMPYYGQQPGEHDWGRVTGRRDIGCTTLDALAEQCGDPDLVKIDTEGHEVQVLRGARRLLAGRKPRLIVEYHTAGLKAECIGILEAEGYDVEIVEPPHFPEGSFMRRNYGWLRCQAR